MNLPDWKIMYVDTSETYYLYDMKQDPDAARDVADQFPEELGRLKERLERYMVDAEVQRNLQERGPISPETRRQLEALGYL